MAVGKSNFNLKHKMLAREFMGFILYRLEPYLQPPRFPRRGSMWVVLRLDSRSESLLLKDLFPSWRDSGCKSSSRRVHLLLILSALSLPTASSCVTWCKYKYYMIYNRTKVFNATAAGV